jgi:hypothetical protein
MGDAVGYVLADAQAAVANGSHDGFGQPLSGVAEGTHSRGWSLFACFPGRARENAGSHVTEKRVAGPAGSALLAGAQIGRPGRPEPTGRSAESRRFGTLI